MSSPAAWELSFHLDVCQECKTFQMQVMLNRKECYLFQSFITWFILALWFFAFPSFMKDEDSGSTYIWNQESLPCNQKKSECDRWKSQQGFILRTAFTRFSRYAKDKHTHAFDKARGYLISLSLRPDYEDEANTEDFKGKIIAIFGKLLGTRLPFHLFLFFCC